MANTIFLIAGSNPFLLRAIALHLKVHSDRHIGIAKHRTTRASQQELDEHFVKRITYQELLRQKADRNVAWIGMQDGYTDAVLHSTLKHLLKRKHLIIVGPLECMTALHAHQYPVQVIHVSEHGKALTSLPASWHTAHAVNSTIHFEWVENQNVILMARLEALTQSLYRFPVTIFADEHGVIR